MNANDHHVNQKRKKCTNLQACDLHAATQNHENESFSLNIKLAFVAWMVQHLNQRRIRAEERNAGFKMALSMHLRI